MAYDNQVRIISGIIKGRRLEVLDQKGLRPTPDRVRESLFNWLNDKVVNAKVLDLFAGSGALGLEAYSRGAKEVTLVENNQENALHLMHEVKTLPIAQGVSVLHQDALQFLKQCKAQFNIIFLDPPFDSDLLEKSVELIIENELIAEDGIVYVEMGKAKKKDLFGLEMIREDTIGASHFGLYQKNFFL